VISDSTGQEFSCALLTASGGSLNWWVLLIFAAVLALCCWACNHASWYYYDEIVDRCPELNGYLPFQWTFGARQRFAKLQGRLRDRTSRSAGVYDPEDQLPLMAPGAPGAPGPPGYMPAIAQSLPTQQMMGSMGGPTGAYDPGMPSGFSSSYQPSPGLGPYMEAPLPPTEAGYDLVTVTPGGLQVTPLGSAPLPAGVPIVNPAHVSMHQFT